MNRKQKIVLWIGIAIVVLMGLFPPWMGYIKAERGYIRHTFIWYHPAARNMGMRIDVPHLCVQWSIIVAITGGLIITFKNKKPKDD